MKTTIQILLTILIAFNFAMAHAEATSASSDQTKITAEIEVKKIVFHLFYPPTTSPDQITVPAEIIEDGKIQAVNLPQVAIPNQATLALLWASAVTIFGIICITIASNKDYPFPAKIMLASFTCILAMIIPFMLTATDLSDVFMYNTNGIICIIFMLSIALFKASLLRGLLLSVALFVFNLASIQLLSGLISDLFLFEGLLSITTLLGVCLLKIFAYELKLA
jgi:hypothetical protein